LEGTTGTRSGSARGGRLVAIEMAVEAYPKASRHKGSLAPLDRALESTATE
jgi:hypothetical protein